MESIEIKNFENSEETRIFNNGKVELVSLGGAMIGKATFQPGWKWSNDVKPIAKTESCQAPHYQYQVSGTMHVVTDDGIEKDTHAGELCSLSAGHDAWVVGSEPVVIIDFQGMADYAKHHKH